MGVVGAEHKEIGAVVETRGLAAFMRYCILFSPKEIGFRLPVNKRRMDGSRPRGTVSSLKLVGPFTRSLVLPRSGCIVVSEGGGGRAAPHIECVRSKRAGPEEVYCCRPPASGSGSQGRAY